MNRKLGMTGVSVLFAIAMLAACGGGGGDGSTAAPSPDNSAPPPNNVAGFAYVANADSNNVSAFTIDATTGALTSIGAAAAAGSSPRSVTVDPSGKFAYVANIGGPAGIPGLVSAYTINAATGALSEIAGSPFEDGSYQSMSVTVAPSGKIAYVANTGGVFNSVSGSVSTYTINATTGALTSIDAAVAAGSGPRSVTVDPSGKFAYVANSGSNDISAYTINATTGALTSIGAAVAAGISPFSITTTREIP
jgi:YVTN family beta-propeller protein